MCFHMTKSTDTVESSRCITRRSQALPRFASIVFAVRHLGNLVRRKFAVQVVSSTTLRCIKSTRGKVTVPSFLAPAGEGFRAGIQRGRRAILHSPHNAPRCLAVRLHFETFSKLGNCIKSDSYLSVTGTFVTSRETTVRISRDSARASSSIVGDERDERTVPPANRGGRLFYNFFSSLHCVAPLNRLLAQVARAQLYRLTSLKFYRRMMIIRTQQIQRIFCIEDSLARQNSKSTRLEATFGSRTRGFITFVSCISRYEYISRFVFDVKHGRIDSAIAIINKYSMTRGMSTAKIDVSIDDRG